MRWMLLLVVCAATPAFADDWDAALDLAVPTKVTATSTLVPAKKDKLADRYAPWRVLNPKSDPADKAPTGLGYRTAWCEGKPDDGVGEALTIAFGKPVALSGIRILAGVHADDALFAANNRPSKLEIVIDGQRTFAVDVPTADAASAVADVALSGTTSSINIKFVAVVPGRMHDTCLSAVQLEAPGGAVTPLFDAAPAGVQSLVDTVRALQPALTACDAGGLARTVRFPLVYEFQSSTPHKRTYASAAQLAKRCAASKDAGGDDALPPFGHPGILSVTGTRARVMDYSVTWDFLLGADRRWRVTKVVAVDPNLICSDC